VDDLARMAEAWDRTAGNYDSNIGSGVVHSLLARRSMDVLKGYFSPPMNILEIGCGTGDTAIGLARAGMRVKAVDVSPEMVRLARKKAVKENMRHGQVEFEVMPAEGIGNLAPAGFDGACSMMGPLNCVADLENFAANLGKLVKPGGWFVASVINRCCPWEIAGGLVRLDAGLAFRRIGKNPRMVKLTREGPEIPVSYYTSGEFFRHFEEQFEPGVASSLGAFIPPTYMERMFKRFGGLFNAGIMLENAVGSMFPLRFIGDHFLITMRRRSKQ